MRAMWSSRKRQNDGTDASDDRSDRSDVTVSDSSPLLHPTATCKRQRKRQEDGGSTTTSKAMTCSMLGCILESVIAANSETTEVTCATVPSLLHSFTSTCTPGISIGDYMTRLASLVDNDSTLVLAALHVRTVLHQHAARNLRLSATNVHRLALAALLCAVKMHEDKLYRNALYAKIGGISNPEINKLEIEFLALIEFNLYVPASEYESFYEEVSDVRLHRNCKCAYGASLLSMSPLQIGRVLSPLSPSRGQPNGHHQHTRPNSPDSASVSSTPSHKSSAQSSPFSRPSSSMSNSSHTSTSSTASIASIAPSVTSSAWSASAPTTPFFGSPTNGATQRPPSSMSGASLSRPASSMGFQSPLSRPASAMGFQSPVPSLHAYNPTAASALAAAGSSSSSISGLTSSVHYPLSPPQRSPLRSPRSLRSSPLTDSPPSQSEPGSLTGHHHGITMLV